MHLLQLGISVYTLTSFNFFGILVSLHIFSGSVVAPLAIARRPWIFFSHPLVFVTSDPDN